MLDLGSEAAWVLIPLRVTFCHWIFFHVVKPLMPILLLLSMLSSYEKHECQYWHQKLYYVKTKKSSNNVTPVGIEPGSLINLWFKVQHSLTITCTHPLLQSKIGKKLIPSSEQACVDSFRFSDPCKVMLYWIEKWSKSKKWSGAWNKIQFKDLLCDVMVSVVQVPLEATLYLKHIDANFLQE